MKRVYTNRRVHRKIFTCLWEEMARR